MENKSITSKKPHLVMLPGLDGTGLLLADAAQAAKKHFTPRVLSYPANHDSEKGDVYKQLLPHIKSFLPKTGQFYVLGESFGGPLAAALLGDDELRSRIEGICFCVTFVQNPYHFPVAQFFKVINDNMSMRQMPEGVLNYMFASTLPGQSSSPLELMKEVKGLLAEDTLRQRIKSVLSLGSIDGLDNLYREGLKQYDGKVVYLKGASDYLIPAYSATHVQHHLPQTQIKEFPTSHLLLQTMPEQAMDYLAQMFLGYQPEVNLNAGKRHQEMPRKSLALR